MIALISIKWIKKIVNKFLITGDKIMPEIHLQQLGFTYSASGPFTGNKERFQNFMQTENVSYI